MNSELDMQKKFFEIKNEYEKIPIKDGWTRTIRLAGSKIEIRNRCKYVDEIGPIDEIEFDEELISLEDVAALGRRVRNLAIETPNAAFYADTWLKMSLADSETQPGNTLSKEDIAKFKSGLPPVILKKLTERKDSEYLFMRLFQAKIIFEPLILIESGFIRVKDGKGYISSKYMSDKDNLYNMFTRDLLLYKSLLEKVNMLAHFNNYINSLQFSTENTHNTSWSEKYPGISRSNYAFMVMVLTVLSEDIKKLAVFNCKMYLKHHKKGKLTKVAIHILSRIIFSLLVEHSSDRTPKGRANCCGFTMQILTAFSPKNENGEPCYSINVRGVENALTR